MNEHVQELVAQEGQNAKIWLRVASERLSQLRYVYLVQIEDSIPSADQRAALEYADAVLIGWPDEDAAEVVTPDGEQLSLVRQAFSAMEDRIQHFRKQEQDGLIDALAQTLITITQCVATVRRYYQPDFPLPTYAEIQQVVQQEWNEDMSRIDPDMVAGGTQEGGQAQGTEKRDLAMSEDNQSPAAGADENLRRMSDLDTQSFARQEPSAARAVSPTGSPRRRSSRVHRIGIMGGTFDPIHNGHLVAASEVAWVYNLDEVIFVPTGRPVFKLDKVVTGAEDRYLMTVIATASNPKFTVSRVDIDRPGVTYTIDTLRDIHALRPQDELFFITGADAVAEIMRWKDADQMWSLAHFVAVSRPGYSSNLTGFKLPPQAVDKLEIPALAISSTDVRKRAGKGMPVWYLVPDGVVQYINKHGLYRDLES